MLVHIQRCQENQSYHSHWICCMQKNPFFYNMYGISEESGIINFIQSSPECEIQSQEELINIQSINQH